jgi:hypothetical protein
MSDTPRTDENEFDWVTASFARKLERELNAANERIRRLKTAGNEMYKFINPPSPCMRSTRMDDLLQGWDDAKININ